MGDEELNTFIESSSTERDNGMKRKKKVIKILLTVSAIIFCLIPPLVFFECQCGSKAHHNNLKKTDALLGNWTPDQYQLASEDSLQNPWDVYWKDTLCFVSSTEMLHKMHLKIDRKRDPVNSIGYLRPWRNACLKTRYRYDTLCVDTLKNVIRITLVLHRGEQNIKCTEAILKDALILDLIPYPILQDTLELIIEKFERGKQKMNINGSTDIPEYFNGYQH